MKKQLSTAVNWYVDKTNELVYNINRNADMKVFLERIRAVQKEKILCITFRNIKGTEDTFTEKIQDLHRLFEKEFVDMCISSVDNVWK